MSIREIIQFFPGIDVGRYMNVLESDFRVTPHPAQPGAFLVDGLPFYEPQQTEDYTFILGFNNVHLSDSLLQVLINHPEIFSEECSICWTQEQDVLLEASMSDLRLRISDGECNT